MESAMFDLPLNKATIKTVGTHQFYIFPKPLTHTNRRDRPPTYANPDLLTRYAGTGSNGSAKLLPGEVHSAANAMIWHLRKPGAFQLKRAPRPQRSNLTKPKPAAKSP
jgi:hypothetical protein